MRYDITIDPKLYDTYPQIRLGCLRFTAKVLPPDADFWRYLDGEVFPQVRKDIEGKAWSEIPGIRGSRAAYKAFGRDPGRYRVSSESLIRRVRRGDELYHINTVVDVNNLISVTSGLSVGSYDLAKVHGPVLFRKAEAGEGYDGIGRDHIDLENLLILADEEGIFGSSMSDSTRTMVTETATDILVVLHCFEDAIDLDALLAETKDAFERYAGAQNAETWIV
ncbi:MAG: hypothetical protein IJT18_07580 [Oscillospiraceae bacterium]|nr:hypothetical protein [Oscillospiraceae bacterium]